MTSIWLVTHIIIEGRAIEWSLLMRSCHWLMFGPLIIDLSKLLGPQPICMILPQVILWVLSHGIIAMWSGTTHLGPCSAVGKDKAVLHQGLHIMTIPDIATLADQLNPPCQATINPEVITLVRVCSTTCTEQPNIDGKPNLQNVRPDLLVVSNHI